MNAAHNDDGLHRRETCLHCTLVDCDKLRAELKSANDAYTGADDHRQRLVLQVEALKAILRKVEYVNDGEVGALWCPVCWSGKPAGHSEGCDLGHALHGAFPPTAEKQEDVLLGDFRDNGCFQPEGKKSPPQEFRVYTSDGKYRIVDGKFQAPQILAPSGSCPCRMEGETLIACERHAMKQKGPSGGHVDGPDRPDRTDHPFHR
jgi:hypothetical protein